MWVVVRKTQTEFPPGPFVLVQVVQAVFEKIPTLESYGGLHFLEWLPVKSSTAWEINASNSSQSDPAITLSRNRWQSISLWNFETSICCVDLSLVPTPVFFSHLKPWF